MVAVFWLFVFFLNCYIGVSCSFTSCAVLAYRNVEILAVIELSSTDFRVLE